MLGVGAEVLALFWAMGYGRRQVFNEYFHSLLAVWRDNVAAGGTEHGWNTGGGGERRVSREAREELRGGWE